MDVYMYLTYTCYVCLVISGMNESNNSRKGRWKLRLIYYYFKYTTCEVIKCYLKVDLD